MRCLSVAVISLVFAATGMAQTEGLTSTVRGRITDEGQGVIPNVNVTFTDVNQKESVAFSDEDGEYIIKLPPGKYSIKAEYPKHDGWEKFLLKGFRVRTEKRNELNIVLRADEEWSRRYGLPVIGEPISRIKQKKQVDSSIFSALTGTIYDQVYAVVPGVEVIARRSDGRIFKATSDLKGYYEIYLPSGEFTIEFSQEAFRRLVVKHFVNLPRMSRSLDVDYLIGKCADCGGAIYGESAKEQEKPIIIDFSKQKDKSKISLKREKIN
ncbi:MAG TPA: carboxypeptidase-like regulatory domain-containing protein [Pyrinomonadaceae bacterium]|nr:carboxypeptidase-like regulatory domain-containing protein [Pyrinomonadaceae bacterium]